ncbi:MAG: hypothetical protein QOH12_74 [Solirubrobacteraceae bacterium]|jgi:hypothetical protein|nr:hypothetical protein [Solirubrobacteraceae bacterium]
MLAAERGRPLPGRPDLDIVTGRRALAEHIDRIVTRCCSTPCSSLYDN